MSLNGVPDAAILAEETFYYDAGKLQEAETQYQEHLAAMRKGCVGGMGDMPNGLPKAATPSPHSALAIEIANIRSKIKNFNLKGGDTGPSTCKNVCAGQHWEDNQTVTEILKQITEAYTSMKTIMEAHVLRQDKHINDILKRLDKLESTHPSGGPSVVVHEGGADSQYIGEAKREAKKQENIVKNGAAKDDDDDIDLFGSDEETEEERRVKEERLKAYADKKSKKAAVIAKSSVVLDVKPWSDETDLKDMETQVRKIESAGLKWGASKLVPLAYGIRKLQIIAIVEDENCSIDWLQEQIESIEDLVQSVDIAAFNKL